MKVRILLIAISVGLLTSQVYLKAEAEMEAKEIMRQVERQNGAADEVRELTMVLIDEKGNERPRTATLYSKQKNDVDDMRLIIFHTPADMKKSGVLTIENSDRDNDQWIYLPAYHTTRRIASANRSDSYMGTDFAYEDITDPKIEEHQYAIQKRETYRETECVVIESIPVDEKLKKESGYSKIISWVDDKKFVTLKEEFYDKEGELVKLLTNSKLTQYGEKHRWDYVEMENVQKKHKTTIDIKSRKLNEGLSDRIFTERYLKRGK